jgi:hypothetical protein
MPVAEPLTLRGMAGDNPLAFLASLGVLAAARVLQPVPEPKLSWAHEMGGWRPRLHEVPWTQESLPAELLQSLAGIGQHPVRHFSDDLKVATQAFRQVLEQVTVPELRQIAEWLSGLAAEAIEPDRGKILLETPLSATALWFTSGQMKFLAIAREICEAVTEDDLREALFGPWRYAENCANLRWDPIDDRRYALRWDDPAPAPKTVVRGAYRLALEALCLLPVIPTARRAYTTGFSGSRLRSLSFCWPIWSGAIGADAVRSLLALGELRTESPPRKALAAMGVQEIYRAHRLVDPAGRYKNFGPAFPP